MAAIVMLPAELGDSFVNKTPTSPIMQLLPDHLGRDILDVGLDQEPGVVIHYTIAEPISTVSPSMPCVSPFMRIHSASHTP